MEIIGQLHAPAALPLGKIPLVPNEHRLARHLEEEKSVLPLPGSNPVLLGRPSRRLMSMPTEPHRLPGSTNSLSELPNVTIISLHFYFYIY
jgi:hypothetical protein